jgi:photosystem II stability/assembly factor-like uncharacterized protein
MHDRLFGSTPDGLFRSDDRGASWERVLDAACWQVTFHPSDPATMFVTTRSDGVRRTRDHGAHWETLNSGLVTPVMGRAAPVIIDPTDSAVLYVGCEAAVGGVYKSRDGGERWVALDSGLGPQPIYGLAMDPTDSAVLYACGPRGVYKTTSGGEPDT